MIDTIREIFCVLANCDAKVRMELLNFGNAIDSDEISTLLFILRRVLTEASTENFIKLFREGYFTDPTLYDVATITAKACKRYAYWLMHNARSQDGKQHFFFLAKLAF